MRRSKCFLAIILACSAVVTPLKVQEVGTAAKSAVAAGRQYATTHVYVASQDLDRFVQSFLATFGGSKSQPALLKITPTPIENAREAVTTSVGVPPVFALMTPIPYPFGSERSGYLVTDMDTAVKSTIAQGADLQLTASADVIGRDALFEWPGGARMELYWHTMPQAPPLESIPENRVYVSPAGADVSFRDFLEFARGKVIPDEADVLGVEIGRVGGTSRRVRIDSLFGNLTGLVPDGHLPSPYGPEFMGYGVLHLAETLSKAQAAGVTALVQPFEVGSRRAAMVRLPGGYIAQIHSSVQNQLGCRAALEPSSSPVPRGRESSPLVHSLLFGPCCCEGDSNNRTAVALPVTRTRGLAVGASLTQAHRLNRRRFSARKKTLPHQQP